jgi:hypothetical protein
VGTASFTMLATGAADHDHDPAALERLFLHQGRDPDRGSFRAT